MQDTAAAALAATASGVAVSAAILPSLGSAAIIIISGLCGASFALSFAQTYTWSSVLRVLAKGALPAWAAGGLISWWLQIHTGAPAEFVLPAVTFGIGALADQWRIIAPGFWALLVEIARARLSGKGKDNTQ